MLIKDEMQHILQSNAGAKVSDLPAPNQAVNQTKLQETFL